jgi:hypothetical protein
MHEELTTVITPRYLDALPGDPAAELLVRELLKRAVGRLRLLRATLMYKSYPRLARPPVYLEMVAPCARRSESPSCVCVAVVSAVISMKE